LTFETRQIVAPKPNVDDFNDDMNGAMPSWPPMVPKTTRYYSFLSKPIMTHGLPQVLQRRKTGFPTTVIDHLL